MCVEFTSKGIDDARTVNLDIGALQRGYDYMIERASIPDARNWGLSVQRTQILVPISNENEISAQTFKCMLFLRATVQVD
jgi:hypothetical protein